MSHPHQGLDCEAPHSASRGLPEEQVNVAGVACARCVQEQAGNQEACNEEPAPTVAFIGPLPNAHQAREWALVLQSQSIAYAMLMAADGWLLRVAALEHERAVDAIDLYEEENENWPPERHRDLPRHPPSPVILLALLAMVLFFFNVTGPVRWGASWFTQGRTEAALLFAEPWRMVTALTLHADGQHVLGNAVSGAIFATMVSRRIGAGAALLTIVLAGALGNAANALYHFSDGHRSIGASTAVFGAVGILAAIQTLMVLGRSGEPDHRFKVVDLLGPVIGGLALLGSLGSSPNSDLGAHGFGFLAGVLVGGVAGVLVQRHKDRKPSPTLQVGLGLAFVAVVGGCWALAALS